MNNELTKTERYVFYIISIIFASYLNILFTISNCPCLIVQLITSVTLIMVVNPTLLALHFAIWKNNINSFRFKHIFLGALFWILFMMASRYLYQTFLA